MPRFPAEAISILKGHMMARLPDCYFTVDDVNAIHEHTGLQSAQIQVWAESLRYRVSVDARVAYLSTSDVNKKVDCHVLHCMCEIL